MHTLDKNLIIAALGKPKEALIAWNQYKESRTVKEYSSELSWAGGYIHFNLRKVGESDEYLRNIYRYNYLTNNFKFTQAVDTLKFLNERFGITPIKSFGLSQFEHSLGQRPVGDFDFYVRPADLRLCMQTLTNMNFCPLMGISELIFDNQIRGSRGSWNFINQAGIDLDAHWRIFDHLSERENKKIIESNAIKLTGKFGEYKGLNLELATLQIGYHHEFSSSIHWGSFFDFVSLLRVIDHKKFLRLAKSVEILELIEKWVDVAENSLEEKIIYLPSKKYVRPATWHRYFHATNNRFSQSDLLSKKFIYKLWEFFGSFAFAEKYIIRIFGTFSKRMESILISEDKDFLNEEVAQLGIGWHYRYPNEKHRWANYPDARIVVKSNKAEIFKISLDPKLWSESITNGFDVFASGFYLGTCDKTSSEFTFVLPVIGRKELEISLRKRPEDRRRIKGAHFTAVRFLAPVKSIEIR